MNRTTHLQAHASNDDEHRFAKAFELGRKSWPHIHLSLAEFRQHLETLKVEEVLRADELYLSTACALKKPSAVESLLQHYTPALLRASRRLGLTDEGAKDLVQLTFQTVLEVKPAQRSVISNYQGRGSLAGWLKTILVRCHRPRPQERTLDAADDHRLLESDTELQLLRSRYGKKVRQSLRDAILALDIEERRLLRQHHIDGVSIDELSRLMKVHRATAARRVARIREKLLEHMREALREQLKVGPNTLDSIMRATRADLSSSLVQALETKER